MSTTTSTSSISTTSSSISTTSSSTSSTSSSVSSTSRSTSSTSRSTSTSSTSSSISSTSSSISSTSSSSTSYSISVSSTSSSMSSTSFSSTSGSTTSQSTSISSTSSSISSTSSSMSSTSVSISSTSNSTSSTSSSTSTTTVLGLTAFYQDAKSYIPAWSYVNNSAAIGTRVSSGSSCTATLGTAVAIGDRVVIGVALHDSVANSVSSVTDSLGNTYNADKLLNLGAAGVNAAVYSATVTVAGTPTVTANFTTITAGGALAAVSAYSGTERSLNAVDGSSSNSTVGGANITSGPTGGLVDFNELAVCLFVDDGNVDATITGNKFLNSRVISGTDATTELVLADKSTNPYYGGNSNPGTATADFINAAGNNGAIIVVYRLYKPTGLPSTNADLVNAMTNVNKANIDADDDDYFIAYGSEYILTEIEQKNKNNTDNITICWRGRSTQSTVTSPVLLQVYNNSTAAWETIRQENRVAADVDFELRYTITTNLSNYYDSNNIVEARVYQLVV